MVHDLSRRSFLARTAILGCSAAASPLLTPVSLASAPWDTRLIVIILRGGMDALDVIQPYGDPAYAGLRKTLAGGPANGGLDLDGYFALHPALEGLMPLWSAGQLGFVQAVATPYRDKRSHFDGQDLLEAGTADVSGSSSGWLNRALQQMPGVETRTSFALGHDQLKILSGPAPVAEWVPGTELGLSPQAQLLAEQIMAGDPAFAAAFAEARLLADEARGTGGGGNPARNAHVHIARFAAEQMRADTRVVAFSLNGWDTHRGQKYALAASLKRLANTIETLREGLGDGIWDKTAIVALTEFGRTARENGSGGTDHGTGGAMLLAGGAIRGGQVAGQWPGLAESDLYQRRDLMPTADIRAMTGWVLRGAIGLNAATIESAVFPGADLGADPGLLR